MSPTASWAAVSMQTPPREASTTVTCTAASAATDEPDRTREDSFRPIRSRGCTRCGASCGSASIRSVTMSRIAGASSVVSARNDARFQPEWARNRAMKYSPCRIVRRGASTSTVPMVIGGFRNETFVGESIVWKSEMPGAAIGVAHGARRKSRRSVLAVRSMRAGLLVSSSGAHDPGARASLYGKRSPAQWAARSPIRGRRAACRSALAVPVVELLQPADHAEPAERDLLRARVPAGVVGDALAEAEQDEAVVAGAEGVRLPAAGRPGDHVTAAHRRLLVVHERGAGAVEHDEQLLLRRMAVRRRRQLPRLDPYLLQAHRDGARGAAEIAPLGCDVAVVPPPVRRHVVDADDVRRPRRRRREVRLARGGVALPWRVARARGHPRGAEPPVAGAGQHAQLGRPTLAEHHDVEPGWPRAQRVGVGAGQVHEAVAGRHLVGRAVLPGQPVAAEHVEDLLLRVVAVGRRRALAGRDLDPPQAELHAAGGGAEGRPGALDPPRVVGALRRLVEGCESPRGVVPPPAGRPEPPHAPPRP